MCIRGQQLRSMNRRRGDLGMRIFLSFVALWLISVFGASNAAALEITEETHGNYLEYLKTIGSAKRVAFAVSPDGYHSLHVLRAGELLR